MYEIREATEEDLTQLVRLNEDEIFGEGDFSHLTTYEKWEEGLWWVDLDLLKWYFSCLQKGNGGILLLTIDGEIAAELDYIRSFDNISNFEGERFHIIWLLVHPNRRKGGLASALIDFFCKDKELQIWVEPEDERSIELYKKFGSEIFSISNWELEIRDLNEQIIDFRLDFDVFDINQINLIPKDFQLLFGRYYAPNYDIQQFVESSEVEEYMWGNTNVPEVYFFQEEKTQVYAVMTQYPRIWVKKSYSPDILKKIIGCITLLIFEMGFDKIFIQIYNEINSISEILEELHYKKVIDHDPVFTLNL